MTLNNENYISLQLLHFNVKVVALLLTFAYYFQLIFHLAVLYNPYQGCHKN